VGSASGEGAAGRSRPDVVVHLPGEGYLAVDAKAPMDSYLAATAVMDAVTHYDGEFDAVVLAGFGEHGKEGLMELLSVPVVDMTEAAAHVAMLLGSRFSVITTLDRAVPLIEDRLLSFGLDRRCAAVRSTGLGVLELEDADVAKRAITEQARLAVEEERAEAIAKAEAEGRTGGQRVQPVRKNRQKKSGGQGESRSEAFADDSDVEQLEDTDEDKDSTSSKSGGLSDEEIARRRYERRARQRREAAARRKAQAKKKRNR